MYALGLVETRGFIGAVEAADVMLKAADTRLLEKVYVGGGLVTITVLGDVAAVQAAVDAAQTAINKLGEGLFISKNVIPRPLEEVLGLFNPMSPQTAQGKDEGEKKTKSAPQKTPVKSIPQVKSEEAKQVKTIDGIDNKKQLDLQIKQNGLDETLKILNGLKVVKLRTLARDIDNFGINGRELAKANKEQLLKEFQDYFKKTYN